MIIQQLSIKGGGGGGVRRLKHLESLLQCMWRIMRADGCMVVAEHWWLKPVSLSLIVDDCQLFIFITYNQGLHNACI